MARKRAVVYFIFAVFGVKTQMCIIERVEGKKKRCCFGYWLASSMFEEGKGKKKDRSGHGGSTLL